MSVVLLWPAALAALGALLLPLLIHLTRRLERTRTDFAALRWIQAQVRPRSRLRIQRWLLLLLRMLLLAVAVLLLAQPVLRRTEAMPPWLAVAPGVAADALASLDVPADATRVWLLPDFPALPSRLARDVQPDATASLLRQLDRQLPVGTELTVVVPEQVAGLDGQRLELSREVQWRVVASRLPATASNLSVPEPAKAAHRLPAELAVIADTDGAPQERFLRAAVTGWNAARPEGEAQVGLQVLGLVDPLPAPDHIVAWLQAGVLPPRLEDWLRAGGTALLDRRTELSQAAAWLPLLRSADGTVQVRVTRIGAGRVVQLGQPLALPDWPLLAESSFATQLLDWLRPLPAAPATTGDARALQPRVTATITPVPPLKSLQWPLALLLAGLLVLERLCAGWPRRSGP